MPNPNLKELSFDRVHDTQEIYRVLLHAMQLVANCVSSGAAFSFDFDSIMDLLQI
jgi:hypothetical protein